MKLYNLGSLFLDISIGLLLLGAVIRLILARTYFKRNGRHTLTDSQRHKVRKTILPVALLGLLSGIVSMVLLLIS